MKPQGPELSLEQYLSNQEFLNDILSQLAKDLGSDGSWIDSYVSGETAFELTVFQSKLSQNLEDLDKKDRLKSILYRIDLPEKTKGQPTRWENYSQLAGLILDREFQKVWFRNWYRELK